MDTVQEYFYPASIKEVLSLLSKDGSGIIAGGTHITTSSQILPRLVDITRLNLSYIKEENQEIIIGSTTTITEILESPITKGIGNGILTKACSLIGDTPLRNKITLGGNIAQSYPWAGLPVVLLVLDAKIVILNQTETSKTLTASEYFKQGKVGKGELIKEVILPKRIGWFCRYEKFSLTTVDYSWLTLAFSAKITHGTIEDSRIAISRIVKASRLNEVEKLLKGAHSKTIDTESLITKIKNSVAIVQDHRSSKEYREHLLGILFKRIFQEMKVS
ncbi:MAG: FAD binding domain-containing protein [Candidatus Hodarchaeales archaeon]|jgi:CO/xanthine dehydrogenase FAD-binding subunit